MNYRTINTRIHARRLLRRRAGGFVVLTALALGMALGPTPSWAAVQVDPNGPAGQQYALPLDAARGVSAGDTSLGVPGTEGSAPVSGQGLGSGSTQATRTPQGRAGSSVASSSRLIGSDPGFTSGIEELSRTPGDGLTGSSEIFLIIFSVVALGLSVGLLARTTLARA